MPLFGQDQPNIGNGWARLGETLVGADGGVGAYADRMKQHGQAADAFHKARISRARAISQEGITPAIFEAAGYAPNQAAIMAPVLGASASPDLRRLGDFTTPGLLGRHQEQQEAMAAGDFKRANSITAILKGRSFEPTKIAGGVQYDQHAPLGESDPIPLPQTAAAMQGRLARDEAAAGVSSARAGVYQAQADAGGWNPNTKARGPKALSEEEAGAKAAWIEAKADEMRAKGQAPAVVDAWRRKEFAAAGMTLAPTPFGTISSGVTSTEARVGPASPSAVTAPPAATKGEDPLLNQAREAIGKGADPAKVKARLIERGRSDLAGSL
jgi:hypothetical protein